jgi:hypothetical protein
MFLLPTDALMLCTVTTALHKGRTNFRKNINCLKIIGARRLTKSKFYIEDQQTLGANVQNLCNHACVCVCVCARACICKSV